MRSGCSSLLGPPDHKVSSLSAMRSCSTPPNTMAPIRPLPTGNAAAHSGAGCWNQISTSRAGDFKPGDAAAGVWAHAAPLLWKHHEGTEQSDEAAACGFEMHVGPGKQEDRISVLSVT